VADTTRLDAELAALEHRGRIAYNDYEAPPRKDWDGLVAAAGAVLKPHQPGRIVVFGPVCKDHEAYPNFSITATEAARVRACPDCTATVYTSCTGCHQSVPLDSCPVRSAISRELAGSKEDGDVPA